MMSKVKSVILCIIFTISANLVGESNLPESSKEEILKEFNKSIQQIINDYKNDNENYTSFSFTEIKKFIMLEKDYYEIILDGEEFDNFYKLIENHRYPFNRKRKFFFKVSIKRSI